MKDLHLCTVKHIGDELCLTAVVKAIQETYPNTYNIHIHTTFPEIYQNNPYVATVTPRGYPSVKIKYGTPEDHIWMGSLVHGFGVHANQCLGMSLPDLMKPDLHLSNSEIQPFNNSWVINAGWQNVCPAKRYDRYQEVVDLCPDIRFIQIGSPRDNHRLLQGNNIVDMVGKTSIRELFSLVYSSIGTLSPDSNIVHIAGCFDIPSIIILGGREPIEFTSYPKAIHFDNPHPRCGVTSVFKEYYGCMALKECPDTIDGITPRCMHDIDPRLIAYKIKEITAQRGTL